MFCRLLISALKSCLTLTCWYAGCLGRSASELLSLNSKRRIDEKRKLERICQLIKKPLRLRRKHLFIKMFRFTTLPDNWELQGFQVFENCEVDIYFKIHSTVTAGQFDITFTTAWVDFTNILRAYMRRSQKW
jgi:hypothetical protein